MFDEVWSGDESRVVRVRRDDAPVAYVKVAPDLRAERKRLEWLAGRLPVARVLAHGSDWLILSPLPGKPLSELKHGLAPDVVARMLARALRVVHAVPVDDCPFGDGPILVHGDACLPNFLFDGERLSGIVDVGRARRGAARDDLAAGVWSLQYNLGPGHAPEFLRAYGIDPVPSDGEIEALRRAYDEPTRSVQS